MKETNRAGLISDRLRGKLAASSSTFKVHETIVGNRGARS